MIVAVVTTALASWGDLSLALMQVRERNAPR
jgi:hypothetical protein